MIKVGSYTNHGYVTFIDDISDVVPDPLVKVSSTKEIIYRLSDLHLVEAPPKETKGHYREAMAAASKAWKKVNANIPHTQEQEAFWKAGYISAYKTKGV